MAAASASDAQSAPSISRMGGAPTAFSVRSRRGSKPFDIVEHCHSIGLGGVQTNPPSLEPETIKKFRERLEAYNMHLSCDPRLPRQESELPAFEAQVKAYKEAGAHSFHAAMTGRRYEEYDAFTLWKTMFEQSQKTIERAEPILRKYKVPLGIENHKGWRSAEQAAWLKRLGSEYVGVCFDFGNNLALCEDPIDSAKILAPYAVSAHIKDMGLDEYEDGFLLSEVAFGEGMVDLKAIMQILREKNPKVIFNLEMITRDPLKIPVFTPKYWATFDDVVSPLPGRDLARTLALVKKNKTKSPLPRVTGLSNEQAVKLEDDLNQKCIEFAHKNLGL